MLKDKIDKDFIEAFKAKNTVKKNTLGILKSRMTEWKAEKKNLGKEIADEDIISIITSEVKKRNQAIELYISSHSEQGDVNAEKEQTELNILLTYLPKQLNDVEIMTEILKVKKNIAEGPLIANVMKHFNTNFKGKFDNKKLQELIKTIS